MRVFLLLCLTAADFPLALAAQEASPYVPLDHWAMPFVEHLITAGVIADPTPLTRPLKQSDVTRALSGADTSALAPSVRATIRHLVAEWQPTERRPHYRVELSAGAAAATQVVRDPLELDRGVPERQIERRAFFNAGLDAELLFGPLIGVSHPIVDTRLKYDPDWYATEDVSTQFAQAYVGGQWRLGEIFFGILPRNWGPSGVQGVLLSDDPYSMDHLAIALGTPRTQLQAVATQLDSRDSLGARVNRFMDLHRLWLHPRGRWTLALWEAGVTSGVGRQLEPWYLNVATLSYFRAQTGTNVNAFLGVDVERHAARATLFGQFMLDDIQVTRHANTPEDLKPASYAFTVGAKGCFGTAAASWLVYYTQVANLTYRNKNDFQVPLYFGLGTGRNFDDYDQATVRLSVLMRPTLLLGPEVTVLRQGEGDPRLPHPLVPQYAATPVILSGIVQRTVRLAIGWSWQLGGVNITGNGGVQLLQNAGHAQNVSKTEWVGSIGVTYRVRHQDVLP